MEMIESGRAVKLVVTPAGTTTWDWLKGDVGKATSVTSEDGKNQQFIFKGACAVYANGGNGFLVEPA